MKAINWDVIILGAGPAGLALATRLASQKVLLLERHSEPAKDIRIGESLPGAAKTLLQRLGVYAEFQSGNHLERSATISIWDKDEPVWLDYLRDPCGPGWLLDRRQFEQMLQGAAIRNGATILYGCRDFQLTQDDKYWSINIDNARHSAPVIVDASGRSAHLARRLGLAHSKLDSQVCLHAFFESPIQQENTCTRLLADRHGWWYSVRLANGKQVLAYHLDAKHPDRLHFQLSDNFLKQARKHQLLADIIDQVKAVEVHTRPAGTAILDINNLENAGPGFLAIGDAAITFDPISSQGLFNALASAECAYKAINADVRNNPTALQEFKQELLAVISHYLAKLRLTYRGPERYAMEPFWSERRN